eukprot:c20373_g1_i1.p1 GENE.c20373_g1_i1~~c20373_g1_i1.p1  ORF type:complete len:160 (-),score=42.85 c20373_g1_i1:46-492(-)
MAEKESDPLLGQQQDIKLNEWSTGLFDCFNDWGICFCGCCCPCIMFGANSAHLEDAEYPPLIYNFSCCCAYFVTMYCGLCCCLGAQLRNKMVHHYKIKPHNNYCVDPWCFHLVCCCCAICQESREIKIQVGRTPLLGMYGQFSDKMIR